MKKLFILLTSLFILSCGLSSSCPASENPPKGVRVLSSRVAGENSKFELPNYLHLYIISCQNLIRRQWQTVDLDSGAYVSISYTIGRNGQLRSCGILHASKYSEFDRSALYAVKASAPFPPLPPQYDKTELELITTFRYQILRRRKSNTMVFY